VTQLLVATRSRGKQAEFRALLAPLGHDVVFPDDIGLPETAVEASLEIADTFEGNARAKAEHFSALSGLLTLADDSGLEVDALGGAPGVHSKRFAGLEGADHDVTGANNAELLRRLVDVPEAERTARYRCVLVTCHASRVTATAEGTTAGRILTVPQGTAGFGYDPLFWSDDLGKSFGEATAAEKDAVSHRGRAVAALIRALSD
jgi:XTP/dITP diphosphohydrolase